MREPRSNLMALAAVSGKGASSPKILGSQKRGYTHGKEKEGNGNSTGAVQESDGEPPGRLTAPCFGVSAPSPAGCMVRQMVSFFQTLFPVSGNLYGRREKKKQRKPSGKHTKELCCSKT